MSLREVLAKVLVDDRAGDGLVAEHGLSIWIETGGMRLLFDTGSGGALARNSAAVGLDLGLVDVVVLSHGHDDHTGGISSVLTRTSEATAYFCPGIDRERFALREGTKQFAGMPPAARAALFRMPREKIHEVDRPVFISENIGLTGRIPRETLYEDTGGPFFLDIEGRQPDPINDDLALWVRLEDSLIVFVGCAHAGLVNTINRIRSLNGGRRIRAVIGGFHLLQAGPVRLAHTISALRTINPGLIAPGHCTGAGAVSVLRNAFGERVRPFEAGTTYRF